MFWECSRWLGHDVVDGNVCSNVGVIQGKLSNIYYKCTAGWIKLVLCSTSFVVPHTQTLCRRRGACWVQFNYESDDTQMNGILCYVIVIVLVESTLRIEDR